MVRQLLLCVALILVLAAPTLGQEMMGTPSVEVANQVVTNDTVTIASAYSEGPGFVVIHIDNNGAPGPVAGFRWLNAGWNYNIKIAIDPTIATPTLFAMLHADTNEIGVYEFGTVEGADGPVAVDGNVVTPSFNIDLISMSDQFVSDNTVTADVVISQVDGFLVIHQDVDGNFGPVAGVASVSAGVNTNVVVELDPSMVTASLWPMLHVDTGTAGTYEFGTVEGADGPVVVDGAVLTFPIWTVPHIRVANQIVTHGDGMEMGDMAPTVVAQSVLAAEDGWLVIHQEVDGSFGPVAGLAQVPAGLSKNVVVELDPAMVTPNLWPMLHVDTGTAGTYEFGTVEGADGPVVVDGNVVTFPINAAPSIVYEGSLEGNVLTVKSALIDAPGWLAIHNDNNGAPGPVIGVAPLLRGGNYDIVVELDESGMTETLFPMLHYDTGTAGVYEFGAVEGADGPVFVGGAVVVGPLSPMME